MLKRKAFRIGMKILPVLFLALVFFSLGSQSVLAFEMEGLFGTPITIFDVIMIFFILVGLVASFYHPYILVIPIVLIIVWLLNFKGVI